MTKMAWEEMYSLRFVPHAQDLPSACCVVTQLVLFGQSSSIMEADGAYMYSASYPGQTYHTVTKLLSKKLLRQSTGRLSAQFLTAVQQKPCQGLSIYVYHIIIYCQPVCVGMMQAMYCKL